MDFKIVSVSSAFFRSPNPPNAWTTWPEYQEPEWRYLNLTVGSTGLTGRYKLLKQCRFFNQVIPEFVDENLDQNIRDLPSRLTCKHE